MHTVDLGIAWTWAEDADFVNLLVQAADEAHVSALLIDAKSVETILRRLQSGDLRLSWLLDRASDEDASFAPLAEWALSRDRPSEQEPARVINVHDHARWSSDKATMHLEFLSHGINVPHTIILPSFADQPKLRTTENDVAPLGTPFVVKPANTTGGGHGVALNVTSLEDVERHRQLHPRDKVLIQQTIIPAYLSEYRGWFRIFAVCDEVIPCWWDDKTHAYEEISPVDFRLFDLQRLVSTMQSIARVCRLDFFSSEMAITLADKVVVVDYVNEMCDMRLQSRVSDGVPDAVVRRIVHRIIHHIANLRTMPRAWA